MVIWNQLIIHYPDMDHTFNGYDPNATQIGRVWRDWVSNRIIEVVEISEDKTECWVEYTEKEPYKD